MFKDAEVNVYRDTKLKHIGCLGYKDTAGPCIFAEGALGSTSHDLAGLYIFLRMFRWKNPIITPNHSPVDALHKPLFYIGTAGALNL